MKRVVIYYSLSGNTKEAAAQIAKMIGADLYQIDLVKAMPRARWLRIIEGGRQVTFGLTPAIKGVPSLTSYDEIILGTPIWAGKEASAVHTLLSNPEVVRKTTAVFTLSGSGNQTKCIQSLKQKLPHLCHVVSLVDHSNALAKENAQKLNAFCAEIKK